MSDFQIHFTEYSSKTGVRKISAAWFVRAVDMADAVRMGNLFLSGMKSGGNENELSIYSIVARGLHGIECVDGLTIWETEAERQARSDASREVAK